MENEKDYQKTKMMSSGPGYALATGIFQNNPATGFYKIH